MRFCYPFLDSWEVNLATKAEVDFEMSSVLPDCCYECCRQQAELGGKKKVLEDLAKAPLGPWEANWGCADCKDPRVCPEPQNSHGGSATPVAQVGFGASAELCLAETCR
ncbi:hypothetical protein llap_17420 [Limosa lapponica baueri]|uniref:Uncharacterized protein n=1 Tax=Limosa lapponica baueri TaxID=1758121 RepID=A0A2I0TES5_LIMLA|nr:hypothetical protein llap_17420 [Limosa lapponica baueri]